MSLCKNIVSQKHRNLYICRKNVAFLVVGRNNVAFLAKGRTNVAMLLKVAKTLRRNVVQTLRCTFVGRTKVAAPIFLLLKRLFIFYY